MSCSQRPLFYSVSVPSPCPMCLSSMKHLYGSKIAGLKNTQRFVLQDGVFILDWYNYYNSLYTFSVQLTISFFIYVAKILSLSLSKSSFITNSLWIHHSINIREIRLFPYIFPSFSRRIVSPFPPASIPVPSGRHLLPLPCTLPLSLFLHSPCPIFTSLPFNLTSHHPL